MSVVTRNVHRSDGLIVGAIHRATGDDRGRYSYQPLDELPAVIYGGECFATGDAWMWERWKDARADIIRWSYLRVPHRTGRATR